MPDVIKGIAKIDRRTKNLIPRLRPGDIALIDHEDIDSVSAQALIQSGVSAIINASASITGRFPNRGAAMLMDSGIPVLDSVGQEIMKSVREGDRIEIQDNSVFKGGVKIAMGRRLTAEIISQKMGEAKKNLDWELESFVKNTLEFVAKEKDLLFDLRGLPQLETEIFGRPVVIVVRGHNYKEDLQTIVSYIKEEKPVLIGVDGGADALLEFGFKPDIIIGDMDSVSERALVCGAELVVHAYADSEAPGLRRLQDLGLKAKLFSAPGTSEDIAMLLSYEKGAQLIVAVGTHSNLTEFLEKGRKGMASTFLVRLKVGSILVDAKGLSQLYRRGIKFQYLLIVVLIALFILTVIISLSQGVRESLRLLGLFLRHLLSF